MSNTSSDATERTRRNTLTLTCLAGLAGLPQVTLPFAQVAQCPLGISLVAAPGRDMTLLSYAKQVTEMSLGWLKKAGIPRTGNR